MPKKSPANAIPVSADAGFELLEATNLRPPREPLIPVHDDAKDTSSHTKIRKRLKRRNDPKGGSSVEIDHVVIADSDLNVVSVAASPAPNAVKPAHDLPLAMVDSQAALPVAVQPPPGEKDIPEVELASSPAINVLEALASEMETMGPGEVDDETGTTKKKRKKKRGESAIEGMLESHGNVLVAVGMVALALLVVAIGGGISFWKKIADQKPIDEGPAIAYLQSRRAHIERDRTQPGEPVIGVVMAGQNVNVDDIIKIKDFTKLQKLNLSHTNVNVTAIDYISEMKSLRRLDLNQANIGDGVMGQLAQLTNLEELYLSNTRVTDQGLMKLAGLKKLRILGIQDTLATGIGLQLFLPDLVIVRSGALPPRMLEPENPP
jgi:hypothetical protein